MDKDSHEEDSITEQEEKVSQDAEEQEGWSSSSDEEEDDEQAGEGKLDHAKKPQVHQGLHAPPNTIATATKPIASFPQTSESTAEMSWNDRVEADGGREEARIGPTETAGMRVDMQQEDRNQWQP